jgi:hypothetical protein
MKKLFFAAFTAVLFWGACTQKKGLSGSEFTNPNILVAGADSIWDDFVHQEDSVIEQERANAIADFERQTQRQMTADETAQMERQIQDAIKANYDEARYKIDSLKSHVVYSATVHFLDDQHMTLQMKTQAPGDVNTTEQYEGTYTQEGSRIIFKYESHEEVYTLSDDGTQLSGRFGASSYTSILTRKK